MFEFLAQYPILSGVSSKQTETQKLTETHDELQYNARLKSPHEENNPSPRQPA